MSDEKPTFDTAALSASEEEDIIVRTVDWSGEEERRAKRK